MKFIGLKLPDFKSLRLYNKPKKMQHSLRKTARRGFASVYTNQAIIEKDLKYTAHNYKPLPVVLCKGQGSYVWDVEGKKYLDFLCGYSSTN